MSYEYERSIGLRGNNNGNENGCNGNGNNNNNDNGCNGNENGNNENDNCNGNGNNGNGRDRIRNRAFVDFHACDKTFTVESNETEAEKVKLKVCLEQSCDFFIKGEIIDYKCTIQNDSNVDLCNLDFMDVLPKETKFINNSFRVDGRKEKYDLRENTLRFRMERLKKHSESIVTFEVRVI